MYVTGYEAYRVFRASLGGRIGRSGRTRWADNLDLPHRHHRPARVEAMIAGTSPLWGQWEGMMKDEAGRQWLAVLNIDHARPYAGRILMADEARPEIWQ